MITSKETSKNYIKIASLSQLMYLLNTGDTIYYNGVLGIREYTKPEIYRMTLIDITNSIYNGDFYREFPV